MDNYVLHIMVHGYNEFNEMKACFTAKVPSVEEAFFSEEETIRAIMRDHALGEELYMKVTLLNNNKVVYEHGHQLI